jgi:hypothetical protein
MRNSLKTWFTRVPDISQVIARFPLATGLMAIFTLILMFVDLNHESERVYRLLSGLVIAAYVSFCIVIASEAKGQGRKLILQVLAAAIICALAWYSEFLRINLVMATGAVLLVLGNVVAWRAVRNDLHVWDFTHKIWTGAVFATLGSIIFLLGILSIIFALKSLFNVDISALMEDYILPIGLGFLAPLYWLSTVPKTDESYQELYDNPGFVSKSIAFLGTWLLSPLALIYALILFAYAVKIAVTAELPKGEIAALTTPFLIIGTLTWLVLEPPFIKDKFLARLFRKTWFFLSIPAAILLAVSVFVRVKEYGITPERFALILAVLWALIIGIWFLFAPKAKRDIRYIPGVAAVLLLIGTFVAEPLSIASQKNRFESNLKPAGLVSESGKLTGGPIEDEKTAQKVKGSLQYLWRQEEYGAIQKIMKRYDYTLETLDDSLIPKNGELNSLYTALGIDDVEMPNRYNSGYRYYNYQTDSKLLVIEPYRLQIGPLSTSTGRRTDRTVLDEAPYRVTVGGWDIIISENDEVLGRFNVKNYVDDLPRIESSEGGIVLENPLVSLPSMSTNGSDIDLYIHSLNFSDRDGVRDRVSLNVSVLIK